MTTASPRYRHRAYGKSGNELDIAIVDDNAIAVEYMTTICRQYGVGTVNRYDVAADAFAAMCARPPHLAFVDWLMKPVNGLALVRRMRMAQYGQICFVPVIMISAQATREFVTTALAAGCHQVIAKPMLPPAVFLRIRQLLTDNRVFALDGDTYRIQSTRAGDGPILEPETMPVLKLPRKDEDQDSDVWQV